MPISDIAAAGAMHTRLRMRCLPSVPSMCIRTSEASKSTQANSTGMMPKRSFCPTVLEESRAVPPSDPIPLLRALSLLHMPWGSLHKMHPSGGVDNYPLMDGHSCSRATDIHTHANHPPLAAPLRGCGPDLPSQQAPASGTRPNFPPGSAAAMCSNRTDLDLTLTEPIRRIDVPQRPSSTSVRPATDQMIRTDALPSRAIRRTRRHHSVAPASWRSLRQAQPWRGPPGPSVTSPGPV